MGNVIGLDTEIFAELKRTLESVRETWRQSENGAYPSTNPFTGNAVVENVGVVGVA